MEALICKCCGAPLERDGSCSYCGAKYRIDPIEHRIVMETVPAAVKTVCVEASIDKFTAARADSKEIDSRVREKLEYGLLQGIGDAVKITMRNDPFSNTLMVRGELRVVMPRSDATVFGGL